MVSKFCTKCGHQLGIGRYCTNCGARVAELPDAESGQQTLVRSGDLPPVGSGAGAVTARPAPPPPPDPGPEPSSARYPLFADTAQSPAAAGSMPAPAPPSSYGDAGPAKRPRPLLLWLVGLLVLAAIAITGVALLLLGPSGADDDDDRTERPRDAAGQAGHEPDAADQGSPLAPVDVEVPGTAPPSVDGDGDRVTFTAANMLDADPTTSWRMAGDGTDAVVTFAFDDAVTVTEVGLVNGYAKIDPPHDWYAGNRRIIEVVWVFDDGTEVAQELDEDRALQTITVDAIETTKVELRLVQVTDPGDGPDARDYTAISDVEISGAN